MLGWSSNHLLNYCLSSLWDSMVLECNGSPSSSGPYSSSSCFNASDMRWRILGSTDELLQCKSDAGWSWCAMLLPVEANGGQAAFTRLLGSDARLIFFDESARDLTMSVWSLADSWSDTSSEACYWEVALRKFLVTTMESLSLLISSTSLSAILSIILSVTVIEVSSSDWSWIR